MNIDVPESHQPGEATAQAEHTRATQPAVAHYAPEVLATATDIIQPTPPITKDESGGPTRDSEPPNKKRRQHSPQFSSIASTVLQRLKQPKEDTPGSASPSPTMPMPAPSQTSQQSQDQPHLAGKACSVCTRASSSLFNPLVQCRCCLGHWHRLCYEPPIPDFMAASSSSLSSSSSSPSSSSLSSSLKSKWACLSCDAAASASRQKKLQQRANTKGSHLKIESPSLHQRAAIAKTQASSNSKSHTNSHTHTVSWSHRPVDDRRAHVASLAPRDMAYWLFRAVEQYPDFAMFPEDVQDQEIAIQRQTVPAPANPATEGRVVARPPQYRNGIINSIRKSQVPAALVAPAAAAAAAPLPSAKVLRRVVPQTIAFSGSAEASLARAKPLFEATPTDPDDDPTGLMDGWPRPGRGMYAAAGADWLIETAALADSGDHLSFSSIVYDESGRKVRENGMPLLVYSS